MSIKSKVKKLIRKILPPKKEILPIIVPTQNQDLLKGKIALITGGSSGIGLAIAKAFVSCGAKVIIAGTNEGKLSNALKQVEHNACSLVLNILDVDGIPEKIAQAVQMFDEKRIDILVNSAGAHHKLSFDNMTEDEFDTIMDTNVKGTFFVCQAMAKYMKQNGIKGHILNLSSSSALRPAWGPYQMSKWAIRGFTLGLAEQLQPYGIVVNAIAPGQTATPMLGKTASGDLYNDYALAGRYITPEEVANLAVFMVSDMGNMVIGDTFYITGGSGTVSLEH